MKSLNNEDRVENENAKDAKNLFVIELMGTEACREERYHATIFGTVVI